MICVALRCDPRAKTLNPYPNFPPSYFNYIQDYVQGDRIRIRFCWKVNNILQQGKYLITIIKFLKSRELETAIMSLVSILQLYILHICKWYELWEYYLDLNRSSWIDIENNENIEPSPVSISITVMKEVMKIYGRILDL